MQRVKSSNTSIDNLAKNLINAKCNSLNKSLNLNLNDSATTASNSNTYQKKKNKL